MWFVFRMNGAIIFITCIHFFKMPGVSGISPVAGENLVEYLNNKSESLQDLFSQTNYVRQKRGLYNIEFVEFGVFWKQNVSLDAPGFFFSEKVLNTSVLVERHKLVYFDGRNSPTGNKHVIMDLVHRHHIIFTRSIDYKEIGVLLTKDTQNIHIYGFNHTHVQFVHTMEAKDCVDAQMFINEGELYLVLAKNKANGTAFSSIYKWLGTHFDETHVVDTTGAFSVTTFTSGPSEIIIFLQFLHTRQVYSTVCQFSFDKIKKIQHIQARHPVHFEKYTFRNRTYFIIFEKSKINNIYTWDENGSQLIKIANFQTPGVIKMSTVLYTNETTVIFAPQTDKMLIYVANKRTVTLEAEFKYRLNISLILYINTALDDEGYPSLVSMEVYTQNGTRVVLFYDFTIYRVNEPPRARENEDLLRSCFNDLDHKIFNQREVLRDFNESVNKAALSLKKENSSDVEKEEDIQRNLEEISEKLNGLQINLKRYNIDENNLVINGEVIIKGLLVGEELSAKNINIKSINNHPWTLEQWLTYSGNQTVSGPVNIKNLITKDLLTSNEDLLFRDLLRKNGDQEIQGKVKVKNLTSNEIFAKQINDVILEDIYLKSKPEPIIGVKSFKNLKAVDTKVDSLNGKNKEDVMPLFNSSSGYIFDSHLIIEDLFVETIDGVNWKTFKESVFQIGKTTQIDGNLVFPEIKTQNITAKSLNGISIDKFFTTSTHQLIKSDLEFKRIYAENITSTTTNNIKLDEAVQFGNESLVEGPVKFDKLYVKNNLELVGKLDKSFFLRNGDRIIGTNESDLIQIYNGKIKIKGNLYIKSITLEPNSKLFVSEEEMNPNLHEFYWTKSTDQILPVRVQANDGMTVPHILTEKINNFNVRQYILNNFTDKLKTNLYFLNVSVSRNVLLKGGKHSPNFNEINKNSVKTNGSFNIFGKKVYTDTLQIQNLVTNNLDGVVVLDALTKTSSGQVKGKKVFENLIVEGNFTSTVVSLHFVDGTDIKRLAKNVIYIDRPQDLKRLHFKNITVSNLYVSRLNDHKLDEYTDDLDKLSSLEKLNNLKVNGNVVAKQIYNVSTINGINFNDLQKCALRISSSGAFISNLEFLGHIKVHNLITFIINDVNVRDLTQRFLYRHINQTVTAPCSFTNIKTENLITPNINNLSTENLIDISSINPQVIYSPHGIHFLSSKIRSLRTEETSPCNIRQALLNVNYPAPQNWEVMKIKGNVTIMDTENIIYKVFERAVTTNLDNTIYGSVNISNNILAEHIFSNGYINGINLIEIVEDAVIADPEEEQVINGRKIIASVLVLGNTQVKKNADCPTLNDMDIPEINRSIVKTEDISNITIRGEKIFLAGLQTDRFYGKNVGGVKTENIVSLNNPLKIPNVVFNHIKIQNSFNITRINHMPFIDILQNRLLTHGKEKQVATGIYYFNNVETEMLHTPSINKIDIDEVVFDIDNQNIFGAKRFIKPVKILGNAKTEYINNIDMEKVSNNSVMPGDNAAINGSVTILKPSVVQGNINSEFINGYPISNIKDILYKGITKSETEKLNNIKNDINEMVKRNLQQAQVMPTDYMYLEKSNTLQISVPNTVIANTITSRGYVLIHITGEESGDHCGLPFTCKCPVQYSIEISPKLSVAILPNKDLQRTFSYDDENMIIHFITNSISTDSTCRTNEAKVFNEASMMTWTTKNVSGAFHQYDKFITGYISGTEFFTLNGKSYAIIGRYYDPITDSHNLDCIVIRFDKDKNKAEEIQRISTKGVWSTYLLHTAQGVTLIIGNTGSAQKRYYNEEETHIYRFNTDIQQFELLRAIPSYGSIMSTGVVLGIDSLLVLGHKTAPLQVLKYDHFFDNYYFYQSFELDSSPQGISVFYTGGFGISDAYLCIVTENENYFIYSFRFIEGWRLEANGELEGLRNLIPFELNNQPYLFAPSTKNSSLLTIVKHGSV